MTEDSDSKSVRLNDGGSIAGYQGTIRDVTRRMQSEQRTQEPERILQSVLESFPHPFHVVDVEDCTIVMANTSGQEARSSGESTCCSFIHAHGEPCHGSENPCPIEEMKRTRRPITLEHTRNDERGVARTVELVAYPLPDDMGNLKHMAVYAVDVTRRKRLEQERPALITAIDRSPDAILITDAAGTIQYVNSAVEAMTGTRARRLSEPIRSCSRAEATIVPSPG